MFIFVIVLLPLSAALLVVLPLGLASIWVLFVGIRAFTYLERQRLAAFYEITLTDLVRPLQEGSWLNRLGQRIRSVQRWKEIAFGLFRFPVSVVGSGSTLALWSGSIVLLTLPATVYVMPGRRANFGIFTIGIGWPAVLTALLGLLIFLLAAPWATLGVGRLEIWFRQLLLGPSRHSELTEAVVSAQAGRVAAVSTAESERRRIERDLHDGAQQRLVALALDLGAARESCPTTLNWASAW